MKDRTLALLGTGSIPYRKELRAYTGSVTGSLLMMQLDYWFARYPDGFYKFLEPTPKHPDYREGDSWTEELGFSKAEFRNAFDSIGVRYSSKSAYSQSLQPFMSVNGEKFYCSYHDKIKGLTWYFRNHSKVEELIADLCKATPVEHRVKPSTVDPQTQFTVNQQSESTVNKESEFTGNVVSEFTEVNKVDLRKSTNLTYVNKESESPFYIQKLSSEINSETTSQSAESLEDLSGQSNSSASLSNNQQSFGKQTDPHGGINSAAPALNQVDNRFVAGRPQNAFKDCGLSVASDPWMETSRNPKKEFAQWVADKRYKGKSSTPLADAKSEIRNNSDRASDLWEEYQSEIATKAKQTEVIRQIPLQAVEAPTIEKKLTPKELIESDPELMAKRDAVISKLSLAAAKENARKVSGRIR